MLEMESLKEKRQDDERKSTQVRRWSGRASKSLMDARAPGSTSTVSDRRFKTVEDGGM